MIGIKEIQFIGQNTIKYNGTEVKLSEQDYKDVKDACSLILSIITVRKL